MKLTILVALAIVATTATADAKPVVRKKKQPTRRTQVYRNPCPVSPVQRLCGTVQRITRRCQPNWFDPYTGYYHDRCYMY